MQVYIGSELCVLEASYLGAGSFWFSWRLSWSGFIPVFQIRRLGGVVISGSRFKWLSNAAGACACLSLSCTRTDVSLWDVGLRGEVLDVMFI